MSSGWTRWSDIRTGLESSRRGGSQCTFSGCHEPFDRPVTYRGLTFDLCAAHADALQAAAVESAQVGLASGPSASG